MSSFAFVIPAKRSARRDRRAIFPYPIILRHRPRLPDPGSPLSCVRDDAIGCNDAEPFTLCCPGLDPGPFMRAPDQVRGGGVAVPYPGLSKTELMTT